jgi:hypothetical protein
MSHSWRPKRIFIVTGSFAPGPFLVGPGRKPLYLKAGSPHPGRYRKDDWEEACGSRHEGGTSHLW